jgi:hypothetical protein
VDFIIIWLIYFPFWYVAPIVIWHPCFQAQIGLPLKANLDDVTGKLAATLSLVKNSREREKRQSRNIFEYFTHFVLTSNLQA